MARLQVAGLMLFSFLSAAYAQKISPPRKPDPVIAEVFHKEIRTSQKDQLSGLIFGALLEQYAVEHKIAPTDEEVKTFVKRSQELDRQTHQEWEKERQDAQNQLKSKTLSAEEKGRIEARLKSLDSLLKPDPREQNYRKQHPDEIRATEEAVAKQMIQAWKVNRSLFLQYGGRVIFQQAGPEPLDAYRQFLQEHEKKGSFKILDKTLEPSFWNYFTNDHIHTFASPEDAKKMFTTPWWLE